MAIAFGQSGTGSTNITVSGQTLVTITGVSTNDAIVLAIWSQVPSNNITGISDGQGSYTPSPAYTQTGDSNGMGIYVLLAATSGSHVVTISTTGALGNVFFDYHTYSGASLTTLDASSGPTDVTNTVISTVTNLVNAGDTVVTFEFDAAGGGGSPSSQTGTLRVNNTNNWTSEDEFVSGSGNHTSSFTYGASHQFKISAVGILPPLGPTITAQPVSTTVYQGNTASFSVTATASAGSLTYQWQVSTGGAYSNVTLGSGGTSASFTTAATNNAEAANGYTYQCLVTDTNGTVTSSAAALTVITTATSAWIRSA